MTGIASDRITNWLRDAALPLWSSVGLDPVGGFAERLTMDGKPDYAAPKRVRVQARQIYVFSHADLLGLWSGGVELAHRGYEFLMRHASQPDGQGGVVCVLDRQGHPLDTKRDTYDHAFVLYAYSWLYRATHDPDVLTSIDALALSIEQHLKLADGGYLEDDSGRQRRWQNPHMHLLEAFIAAYEATRRDVYLDRAQKIVALFRSCFFDPGTKVLGEYFTPSWLPAAGDEGQVVEPGHHFEWVWLLHRFAKVANEPVIPEATDLYETANMHGRELGSGLVFDEISREHAVRRQSKRCWPQTEALKAEIAVAGAGGRTLAPRADKIVDNLFRYYLEHGVPGGWNDVVDEHNRPVSQSMPASTLYHVFLAFSEYLRAAS